MKTFHFKAFEIDQVTGAIDHVLSHNFVSCECNEEWCKNEKLQECPACALNRVRDMLEEN